MKIKASCLNAGSLVVNTSWRQDKDGNSVSGNLADYAFNSPFTLHAIAKNYTWVLRPGKKSISGGSYSLQMARNDFANFAGN